MLERLFDRIREMIDANKRLTDDEIDYIIDFIERIKKQKDLDQGLAKIFLG
ncbi:MAG: hypothetical protein LC101_08520 [Flavobacteriales bacterium]|nr:hypothetical protein [Flavobacteriales bacterium]